MIELPDATVVIDQGSERKRHLPDRRTIREVERPHMTSRYAIPLCGVVSDELYLLHLGDVWHLAPCQNCLENPSQL